MNIYERLRPVHHKPRWGVFNTEFQIFKLKSAYSIDMISGSRMKFTKIVIFFFCLFVFFLLIIK